MPTIYSLTISLNDWTPRIWRRLWVRGDMKLNEVATILYLSMGWSGYHLSEIIVKERSYGDRSIDPPSGLLEWTEYTLDDIAKDGLTQFQFLYDFGDSWQMTVKIKEEKKLDSYAPYPVCVNGENAGPPEDMGSCPGFDHFIKVMKNKKHPEYKELSEWWGDESFDPTHFSVDEINSLIQDKKEYQDYVKQKLN